MYAVCSLITDTMLIKEKIGESGHLEASKRGVIEEGDSVGR